MILPDVNILLYAFRTDAPNHKQHLHWLEDVVNGNSVYGIALPVLSSVVRIATHPRIFNPPSRLEDVLMYAEDLQQPGRYRPIEPGTRHWSIFTTLCKASNAKGNLVQDAWLAALAIESGCEWITTDGDFARFEAFGLRWRRPF